MFDLDIYVVNHKLYYQGVEQILEFCSNTVKMY